MTIKQSRKQVKSSRKTASRMARTKTRDNKHTITKSAKSPRPITSFAGMWANDETFDEFVAAMRAYRKTVDSDPRQP